MKRKYELAIEEAGYAHGCVFVLTLDQERARILREGESFYFRINEDVIAVVSIEKHELVKEGE